MVEVALDSPLNVKPVTLAEEKEEMDTASPANKVKVDAKSSFKLATEAAPVAVEGASPVSPEAMATKNPEAVVGEKRSSEAASQPAKASRSPAKSPAAVTENDGNSNVEEASSIA